MLQNLLSVAVVIGALRASFFHSGPQEAIDAIGSNCFSRESVQAFLMKPIATCDLLLPRPLWIRTCSHTHIYNRIKNKHKYSGVASSIPARSHTFVEIDREIISTVILLPSAESFKKGCCQLQAKVCARSTG